MSKLQPKTPEEIWGQVQKNVTALRKQIYTAAETFGSVRLGAFVEVNYNDLAQILDFITNAKQTLDLAVKIQEMLDE